MSFRKEPETVQEYIRMIEDRLRAVESKSQISARSWSIAENSNGDIEFTHQDGKIVTIGSDGPNVTI